MKNLLLIPVIIFTSFSLNAQKKIFNKENQLRKIIDKNKKELGDWEYDFTDSFDSIYVIGKEKFDDENKNGTWEAYYTTGNLHSKGAYKNNEKDGFWERYDKDNILIDSGNYKNGLKNGEWISNHNLLFSVPNQLGEKSNFILDTLDGNYEKYYQNGNLEMKGNYVKGFKDGRWLFYHQNGQLDEEITFVNQEKHGLYKSFHDNGVPFLTGQYEMGKKVGTWTYYDNENFLGYSAIYRDSLLETKWFYNNGKVKRIGNYKFSKEIEEDCKYYKDMEDCPLSKDGDYTEYFEDGSLSVKFFYKNGLKEGHYTAYHANGNISVEGSYSQDMKQNEWKIFYENGKLEEKGTFVDSYEQGKWEYYFENGNLNNYGEYKDGKKDGKWIHYDFKNPKIIKETLTYSNGYAIDGPKPTSAPR